MEVKVTSGKVGKEDRKGVTQEKKQLGIKDKEDKKGAKLPGKEVCMPAHGLTGAGLGGGGARHRRGCRRWVATPAQCRSSPSELLLRKSWTSLGSY